MRLNQPPARSLERTRTSRFGYGKLLRLWRLVRAAHGEWRHSAEVPLRIRWESVFM
jgi:hypothetical protein